MTPRPPSLPVVAVAVVPQGRWIGWATQGHKDHSRQWRSLWDSDRPQPVSPRSTSVALCGRCEGWSDEYLDSGPNCHQGLPSSGTSPPATASQGAGLPHTAATLRHATQARAAGPAPEAPTSLPAIPKSGAEAPPGGSADGSRGRLPGAMHTQGDACPLPPAPVQAEWGPLPSPSPGPRARGRGLRHLQPGAEKAQG